MLSITFDECATALLPYVPGLLYNKNVDWPKLEQASIYFVDKILQTFGTIVHQTKTLLTKEILSILIHSKFAKLDVYNYRNHWLTLNIMPVRKEGGNKKKPRSTIWQKTPYLM